MIAYSLKTRFFALIVLALLLARPVQAQDWAKANLDKSPRHGEWVSVKNGSREVKCFIVYPEVANKATAVVVVHEIFGLTDWVRNVCDQLAAAGYVAIAPDMLSGQTFVDVDDARKAIFDLPPDQILGDLTAAASYVKARPAANGKVAVMGFCWGGGQSFRFASSYPGLAAAFPFYGESPQDDAAIRDIKSPLYGFFAENDARITAGLPKTEELLKAGGKKYEFVVYKGAGHGFMRAGEAPDASVENKKARDDAWERLKKLLSGL